MEFFSEQKELEELDEYFSQLHNCSFVSFSDAESNYELRDKMEEYVELVSRIEGKDARYLDQATIKKYRNLEAILLVFLNL